MNYRIIQLGIIEFLSFFLSCQVLLDEGLGRDVSSLFQYFCYYKNNNVEQILKFFKQIHNNYVKNVCGKIILNISQNGEPVTWTSTMQISLLCKQLLSSGHKSPFPDTRNIQGLEKRIVEQYLYGQLQFSKHTKKPIGPIITKVNKIYFQKSNGFPHRLEYVRIIEETTTGLQSNACIYNFDTCKLQYRFLNSF